MMTGARDRSARGVRPDRRIADEPGKQDDR